MIKLTDDLQRQVLLPRAPLRIVSLLPSETMNLFALGAGARLVGATSYCELPPGAPEVPRVGGTKDADPERIAALAPDLVLANQEENARTLARALAERSVPLFVSFPRTVGEGVAHLARLARILELLEAPQAKAAVAAAYAALRAAEAKLLEDAGAGRRALDAFVPIWMEPLMTISGGTMVGDALRLAGARNLFSDRKRRLPLSADLGRAEALSDEQVGARDTRYPRITLEELRARDPELILLPDEPYAFGAAEVALFAAEPLRAARAGAIRLCRGRDLMWPGAASTEGLPRLRALVDSVRG